MQELPGGLLRPSWERFTDRSIPFGCDASAASGINQELEKPVGHLKHAGVGSVECPLPVHEPMMRLDGQ